MTAPKVTIKKHRTVTKTDNKPEADAPIDQPHPDDKPELVQQLEMLRNALQWCVDNPYEYLGNHRQRFVDYVELLRGKGEE